MNTAPYPENAWGRKGWIVSVLLIFAGQIALVFWLSDRAIEVPALAEPPIRVRIGTIQSPGQAEAADLKMGDPTLFALVTEEGFSKRAWLTIPPFTNQLSSRPEPPHYLALTAEDLTEDFAEFVQTNVLGDEVILDRLTPSFTHPGLPIPVVVNSTIVTLEGPLAGRGLQPGGALPQQGESLTNTVVQVTVNDAGAALSAALISSSGVLKADQEALAFARTARFAPRGDSRARESDASGVISGHLVFHWWQVRWGDSSAATARNGK